MKEIHNPKTVVLFPVVLALVLIAGIFIGINFNRSGVSDRLLIYPKPDQVNNVLDLIEDSYVDTVSREKLEEAAIESVLKNLDPHSVYIPADEVESINETLEGNFSGIGIQYYIISDTIVVINTTEGSPARKAGIKPGDRIVMVNDTLITGKEIAMTAIARKLRGKQGTQVKITIKRPAQSKLLSFHVQRDQIPIYSLDISYMIAPETGYIKLSKFAKNTYDEFVSAVKQLHSQGMKKLLVDLRGNSGGYLESAIQIADEFLDDHILIVYTKGRARPRFDAISSPGGECLKDSVVIIIDESSASASEIVAGAIQDNDRGWIVGRRSFGKGLVQEPTLLPGGSAIRLTIARYFTPTGRCIQKPYNKGTEKYENELRERIQHGEMEKADSIKFGDTARYITRAGRILYGGGGIMPDFFVPADTSGFSSFYYKLLEKGMLPEFAYNYSDKERSSLEKFSDYQSMVNHMRKDKILTKFMNFAREKGIKASPKDIRKSATIIETYIEAYVVRNYFDNNGFYKVINSIDRTIKKAIEVSNARNNLSMSLIKVRQPVKRQKTF